MLYSSVCIHFTDQEIPMNLTEVCECKMLQALPALWCQRIKSSLQHSKSFAPTKPVRSLYSRFHWSRPWSWLAWVGRSRAWLFRILWGSRWRRRHDAVSSVSLHFSDSLLITRLRCSFEHYHIDDLQDWPNEGLTGCNRPENWVVIHLGEWVPSSSTLAMSDTKRSIFTRANLPHQQSK